MNYNFAEAESYLNSLIPKLGENTGAILRLERITCLLHLLGNPEKSFPSIHVGGTAGKGSTCYITAEILKRAGYKVGLHISPHLEKVNERMQVNGLAVSDREFCALVSWIKPYVEKTKEITKWGRPTYFETLVAMTFEYFRRKKVQIAVVEVGLGGALDATNVLRPLVIVLTNVHLDHTHILGKTVEKIARDKGGIIKEGIDVITTATQKSVLKIIRDKCKEKHADLKIVKAPSKFIQTALKGAHQQTNIACAIAAVRALKKHGFKVSQSAITQALQKIRIPGRFEIFTLKAISYKLKAVLDGAHNPVKMQALAKTLKHEFPNQKITFIVAVKKTKNVRNIMRAITPLAGKFIITQFWSKTDLGAGASMEPAEIKRAIRCWNKSIPIKAVKNPFQAFEIVKREAEKEDVICITGSLYLAGELRAVLKTKRM